MSDEKKIKDEQKLSSEELTDEQANKAAGGIGEPGWTSQSKKCANPGCKNTMPWNWGDSLCPTCRQAKNLTIRYR